MLANLRLLSRSMDLGGDPMIAGTYHHPQCPKPSRRCDTNPNPTDSAIITLTDASGKPTDANGTLTGTGLTETSTGVYSLAATSPSSLTTELDALTFHPTGLPSGTTSVTTNFALNVTDPNAGLGGQTATDNTTKVVEPPPPPPPPPTGPSGPPQPSGDFQINDQTSGRITYTNGDAYTGPVTGTDREIILLTSDNLNVMSNVPNMFLHTGSGEDAIDVSAANGNNTLDGSTGSNFLRGGTGDDTFFTDNQGATSAIWTKIANFHAGDVADIWGIQQGDQLIINDNLGAAGFTGLTISTYEANGTALATETLSGYTSADLTNGKLTLSYGKTADLPGLPGSYYMAIVGN
jgi:RTX calcium-binding nonapeptide repeat (4 copies)